MNWGSLLAIYFVVWWTILFAVLPWGLRTQEEEGDVVLGTTASAPARPRLLIKAFWTSIVSAVPSLKVPGLCTATVVYCAI